MKKEIYDLKAENKMYQNLNVNLQIRIQQLESTGISSPNVRI